MYTTRLHLLAISLLLPVSRCVIGDIAARTVASLCELTRTVGHDPRCAAITPGRVVVGHGRAIRGSCDECPKVSIHECGRRYRTVKP